MTYTAYAPKKGARFHADYVSANSLKELVKEVASTEWEAVLIEHELGYDTATLSDIGVDEFNRHVHLERMKDYTPEHLDPMTAAKFEEK